jgi:hypothetical protein
MLLHLRTKTQVAVNTLASLPILAEGAIDVTTVGGGVTSGQEVVTTRTCKRVGGSGFGLVPRSKRSFTRLAQTVKRPIRKTLIAHKGENATLVAFQIKTPRHQDKTSLRAPAPIGRAIDALGRITTQG